MIEFFKKEYQFQHNRNDFYPDKEEKTLFFKPLKITIDTPLKQKFCEKVYRRTIKEKYYLGAFL